jgi:hypothetical protein
MPDQTMAQAKHAGLSMQNWLTAPFAATQAAFKKWRIRDKTVYGERYSAIPIASFPGKFQLLRNQV